MPDEALEAALEAAQGAHRAAVEQRVMRKLMKKQQREQEAQQVCVSPWGVYERVGGMLLEGVCALCTHRLYCT